MFLILFVVNASASSTFPICYGKCMFFCVVFGPKITCAMQCLLQCYLKKKFSNKRYYCNLGCASEQCAKFGNGMIIYLLYVISISCVVFIFIC
ncbi:hypothetical protein PHJA_000445900 [Phtheirospermum japonicum]|uniref:Uncharacterized protein n=1 Tax=Phtheirospermum japonicum TaxID=374723 RepID=A0A830BD30_9LAMI|nr:hypothetical protein PHJA_000445900 [Phtheirospermum japonicum]